MLIFIINYVKYNERALKSFLKTERLIYHLPHFSPSFNPGPSGSIPMTRDAWP